MHVQGWLQAGPALGQDLIDTYCYEHSRFIPSVVEISRFSFRSVVLRTRTDHDHLQLIIPPSVESMTSPHIDESVHLTKSIAYHISPRQLSRRFGCFTATFQYVLKAARDAQHWPLLGGKLFTGWMISSACEHRDQTIQNTSFQKAKSQDMRVSSQSLEDLALIQFPVLNTTEL